MFWDFRIQRKHIFVHRETLRAFRCFCLNLRRIFAKHHLRRVEVMVRGEIWYGMSIDDLSVCGQHPGPTFPSTYLDTQQCQNAA